MGFNWAFKALSGWFMQALSQNFEKRLLAFSRLSVRKVRPHETTGLPQDESSLTVIFE
jgi:hypothetical protein